jgi:hypothetical protein
MSTIAACSATSAGWWRGAMRMAVPIRAWRVRAATAVANASGCGRYPSSKRWCSDSQIEWQPSLSASSHISNVNPYSRDHSVAHSGGFRMSK